MTTPNLAKIEQERDLNKAWAHEAYDFTPWLAANISELGEALGMELGDPRTEVPVGGYSLDILATDLSSDTPVIVENQLGTTDHTHLGQLLTYAAGLNGGTVVWVTADFRDEHRQALDWLNQRTDEQTQFFGVVVELWRIGDSPLAPHFKVVATPNEWRKKNITKVRNDASALSEIDQRYLSFFSSLFGRLRKEDFAIPRNIPRRYSSFQIHGGLASYGANFPGRGLARVEVNIYTGDSDFNYRLLQGLEEYKNEIEGDLGALEWRRMPKSCRISLDRSDSAIEDSDDDGAEIQDWMVDTLIKFKSVFDPKLADLNRSQGEMRRRWETSDEDESFSRYV